MIAEVGAVVAFVAVWGTTNICGRVYATAHWQLADDWGYVLGGALRSVVLGCIAATGSLAYVLAPSAATLAAAVVSAGVVLVATVGRKWRRLLGTLVYERTDLMSGPPVKERLLAKLTTDGDTPDDDERSGDGDTDGDGPSDRDRESLIDRYVAPVFMNVESLVGTATAMAIGGALTLPVVSFLLGSPPPSAYGGWLALGVVLGVVANPAQTYRTPADAPDGDDRKNVVLFLVDDLRRDRLSLYGHDRTTTPFLDSLDDAYVFENAVAPGTSSGHSVPTMLSGTFATVHEYGHNVDLWYLPDAFDDAGYATACLSGNPHVTNSLFGDRFDWFLYVERGKRYLFEVYRVARWVLGRLNRVHMPVNYYIVDSAFMNQLAEGFLDAVHDRPFFLYIHYQDLHEPYLREREHLDAFVADYGESITYGDWVSARSGRRAEWYDPILKDWGYDEKVRDTDDCIREIVTHLDERGVLNETVIAVASDHGELLGEREMWGHPDLPYNTLFEVPLVLWDPDRDGGRVDTVTSGAELPRLLLDLAGVDPGDDAREQWVVDRDTDRLLADAAETRPALVDYFYGSVSPKGYDLPLDYDTPGYHRLLLDTEWKLYEVDGERHWFRYDDEFLNSPVPAVEVPEETRDAMSTRLDTLDRLLRSRSRADQVDDPYRAVDDQHVRQQLEDLGYM